jgi:hypothetical protein
VQTCNGTAVDTKIAAYDGGACPTGAALACNDDTCGLQSVISFSATAGNDYLIRIGTFPGEVGGTGTFSISCPPVDLPCQLANCQNFATDNASQSNDTAFTSADDFFCPVAGSNGALCWWGAYLPSIAGDAFSVTYYMDGGGFPGGTIGGPFVQPFTLSVTGPEDTGQLVAGIAPIYEYSATHGEVALGGGNCYWLEVKNNPEGGVNWFWEWSFDGNGIVVVDDLAASPGYGPEDIQLGNDFAWCLDVAFDAGCVPVGADNNTCETAEAISGQGSFAFDNLFATTDGAEDILCDSFGSLQIEQDVWFCWTAPCSAEVRFETCNGTAVDTKIAVYEGCVCPTGPAIACNDDDCGLQSGLQFTAEFGNTYLLRVGTFPGAAGGAGTFSLTCIEAIDNENCENAIALDVPSNTVGSTVFASASEAPACGAAGAAGAGGNVWYSVTGDGTTLSASTCPANFSDCCAANGSPGCDDADCEAIVCGLDSFCCETEWDGICAGSAAVECGDLCGGPGGTDFDTILSVYCNDCDELVCVAGNDDDCGLQSTVSWCTQAGASYVILVHGFGGAEGNFSMDLSSDGLACTGPVTPCIPVGGCCIGADCLNGLTEAECAGAGGEYQGDGAICEGGFVGYEVQAGGAFEDISGTGTEAPVASNTDDGGDIVPLPFSFNYFGESKTEIGVCSNGYLTFDGTLGDFTNDAIPNPAPVNDMLCPLWDDWSPNQAGTVVYQDTFGSGPDRFMAQWTDVPHFGGSGSSTFQAELYADGSIEYRYGDITIDSPTVGIENAAGDAGIDSTGTEPGSIRYQAVYTDPIECCSDAPMAACNASFIPPPYGDTTGPPRNIHIAFGTDSPCDLDLEVNAYIEYCGGTIPVTNGEDIRLICAGNSTGSGACQDHSDNHGFTWIVSAWANLVVEATDANGTTVCEQDLCAVIPQGGGNGNNLVSGRVTATPSASGSGQDDVR